MCLSSNHVCTYAQSVSGNIRDASFGDREKERERWMTSRDSSQESNVVVLLILATDTTSSARLEEEDKKERGDDDQV
jgi:hypothetical protein